MLSKNMSQLQISRRRSRYLFVDLLLKSLLSLGRKMVLNKASSAVFSRN